MGPNFGVDCIAVHSAIMLTICIVVSACGGYTDKTDVCNLYGSADVA
jgi:hypothetical protein